MNEEIASSSHPRHRTAPRRRFAIAVLLLLPFGACTSTPEPIEVTIQIEGVSSPHEPIELSIRGRGFEKHVEVAPHQDTARLTVPGPGIYIIETDGVVSGPTGPTSGCYWWAEIVNVEVLGPVTIPVDVTTLCG